jgi:hypothetical protein
MISGKFFPGLYGSMMNCELIVNILCTVTISLWYIIIYFYKINVLYNGNIETMTIFLNLYPNPYKKLIYGTLNKQIFFGTRSNSINLLFASLLIKIELKYLEYNTLSFHL